MVEPEQDLKEELEKCKEALSIALEEMHQDDPRRKELLYRLKDIPFIEKYVATTPKSKSSEETSGATAGTTGTTTGGSTGDLASASATPIANSATPTPDSSKTPSANEEHK